MRRRLYAIILKSTLYTLLLDESELLNIAIVASSSAISLYIINIFLNLYMQLSE